MRNAWRLPPWRRSIRFRATMLYSATLLAAAALLTTGVYAALERSLSQAGVAERHAVDTRIIVRPDATRESWTTTTSVGLERFERRVNEHALAQLRLYSLVALALAVAGAGLVGWWLSGRILGPVRRIADVARDIEARDLTRRIRLDGPRDELGQLSDTFDAMLDRLERGFASQRRFMDETSHELRTPLAVIRANLDVALATDDSVELRHAAAVGRSAAERMSRLVDDLLASARARARTAAWHRFDLADLARQVAVENAPRARAAERKLLVDAATAPAVGDEDAIRRAIQNLLDNALRFAPRASTIRLRTSSDHVWSTVAVSDDGAGLDAADHERAFDDYWRRDEGARTHGTGLGLAIVRDVARTHGGDAWYESETGRGATFSLRLPRAEGEPMTMHWQCDGAGGGLD